MKLPIYAVAMCFMITSATGALGQDNPFAANAPTNPFTTTQADRYTGTFSSGDVKLLLTREGPLYNGELYYFATQKTYPITASLVGDRLEGTFSAAGSGFPFTFQLNENGGDGVFKTEGFEGTLVAQNGTLQLATNTQNTVAATDPTALFAKALELVRSIPSATQPTPFATLIDAHVDADDLTGAEQLLNIMPFQDIISQLAVAHLVRGYAKRGDLVTARAKADSIAGSTAMAKFAYGYIATAMAKQGDPNGALLLVNKLGDAKDKPYIYTQIAIGQNEASDHTGAISTLADAVKAVRKIRNKEHKSSGLISVSTTYAQIGEPDVGISVALTIPKAFYKIISLTAIANIQAKAGDADGARATIASAEKALKKVDDVLKDSALSSIAVAKASAGDMAGAQLMLAQINYAGSRSAGNAQIAIAQLEQGNFEGARTMAINIDDTQAPGFLVQWAKARAKSGDYAKAIETAQNIDVPGRQAEAYARIAAEMLKQGRE